MLMAVWPDTWLQKFQLDLGVWEIWACRSRQIFVVLHAESFYFTEPQLFSLLHLLKPCAERLVGFDHFVNPDLVFYVADAKKQADMSNVVFLCVEERLRHRHFRWSFNGAWACIGLHHITFPARVKVLDFYPLFFYLTPLYYFRRHFLRIICTHWLLVLPRPGHLR